ncbi:hypothetical protein K8I61_00345 [bacterium]|nr:hypothetical protein [bacterium]
MHRPIRRGVARGARALYVPAVIVLSLARSAAAQDAWDLIDEGAFTPRAVLSGDFQSRTTADLVADDAFEDFVTTRELLFARALFNTAPNLSVLLSGIVDYEIRGNRDFEGNGATFEPRLEELYADVHVGQVDLRLGHQIVTWGRTDVVSPTDTVNSWDLRRAIDTELGHVKIPNLMAKADYYVGPWRFEAIYIPFFAPARVDLIGGDFAPFGNRVPIEQAVGFMQETEEGRRFVRFADAWFPDWRDELADEISRGEMNGVYPMPDAEPENGELAARASLISGPVGASVSYIYGLDDVPTLYLNPVIRDLVLESEELSVEAIGDLLGDAEPLPLFETRYERRHQFGADFAANLGPSVVRAEGVLQTPRHLYTDELRIVERPAAIYTAAVDYTFSFDLLINAQVLQMFTLGDTDDLLTDRAYTFFIAYARQTFFEDKLEVYAQLLYNLSELDREDWNDGDVFGEDMQFSTKTSYDITPDLEIGAGVIAFGGPEGRLLSFAHERNFAFVDGKYSF